MSEAFHERMSRRDLYLPTIGIQMFDRLRTFLGFGSNQNRTDTDGAPKVRGDQQKVDTATRNHHFQFKYFVASLALQDPERYFTTFSAQNGLEQITKMWIGFGQQFPEAERIPPTDLELWARTDTLPNLVVLTLPLGTNRNEAIYIAAPRPQADQEPPRVYCLERSWDLVKNQPMSMLIAMTSAGRMNLGPYSPDLSRDQFIDIVDQSHPSSAN
jgi:hypothetical protein